MHSVSNFYTVNKNFLDSLIMWENIIFLYFKAQQNHIVLGELPGNMFTDFVNWQTAF